MTDDILYWMIGWVIIMILHCLNNSLTYTQREHYLMLQRDLNGSGTGSSVNGSNGSSNILMSLLHGHGEYANGSSLRLVSRNPGIHHRRPWRPSHLVPLFEHGNRSTNSRGFVQPFLPDPVLLMSAWSSFAGSAREDEQEETDEQEVTDEQEEENQEEITLVRKRIYIMEAAPRKFMTVSRKHHVSDECIICNARAPAVDYMCTDDVIHRCMCCACESNFRAHAPTPTIECPLCRKQPTAIIRYSDNDSAK